MSRQYDKRTNMFNQDGQITQINYAVGSIDQAGFAVALLYKDGIVLVCKQDTSETLLEIAKSAERIFELDSHLFVIMSGQESDANYIIDNARQSCQYHRYNYRCAIPIKELVTTVCNWKQENTLRGGRRPFGIGFTYAGWDEHNGFQIWHSDPAAVFGCWKAHAQGSSANTLNTFLKQEFKDGMEEQAALELAVSCACKALDATDPDPHKINLVVLNKKEDGNKVVKRKIKSDQIKKLLDEKIAKDEADRNK